MEEKLILKNCTIFNSVDGTLQRDMDILIKDCRICSLGKLMSYDETEHRIVDCTGKYVFPGLFECHGHLTYLTRGDHPDPTEMLRDFVNQGITSVRDVGGSLSVLKKMSDDITSGLMTGPTIYYAGPMLEKSPLHWEHFNKTMPGFTRAINTKDEARDMITELVTQGASLVKVFNKFDRDVFKCLISQARENNLPVVVDPGLPLFHAISMEIGIALGIRCFEHGISPWPVVLHDEFQQEYDRLNNADTKQAERREFLRNVFSRSIHSISIQKLETLMEKMCQNNVYFCPTLTAFQETFDPDVEAGGEELSEEEIEGRKKADAVMRDVSRFITQHMIKKGVKILVGQDGAAPANTFQEMYLLHDLGLSETEIIKGATCYPAEWLGIDDRVGSLAPEKNADLLVLNHNPLDNIRHIEDRFFVCQNGKIVPQEGGYTCD